MPIKCGYCDWFTQSDVLTRGDKSSLAQRKCIAKKRKITEDSESCRYFKPVYFYCEKYNCRLLFEQCIGRRRNRKNLTDYLPCKKCRQFDTQIREIVQEYFIDMVPTVTPRHLLTRGNENGPVIIGSGKIKRRGQKKEGQKRKIKRRDKGNGKPKGKAQKRKIKRRQKSETPNNNGLSYTICPKCGQQAMREDYCRVCAYKAEQIKRKIKRRSKNGKS